MHRLFPSCNCQLLTVEIIEDLLDIQIFSVMNSLLKDKIATNKTTITDNKYKLEMVVDKIDIHKKHLEAQKVDNTQLIADKQSKITKLSNDVTVIKKNVEAFNKEIEELRTKLINKDKLSAKQSKLQTLQRQIGERVKKTTKEIEFLQIMILALLAIKISAKNSKIT